MTPGQKKLVVFLSVVVGVVFVTVAIAALTGSPDETTTTTLPPETSTTASTTTTAAETTTTTSSTTTTSTSTTTTTTQPTTTTTEAPRLVLREDGLGEVAFGTEAESAIARLSEILGPPDVDDGWQPSFSGFGTCPGEEVRGVRWGTLWTLYSDGPTEWSSDGTRHFFAYLNSVFYDTSTSLGLLTEEGIGLGDSVAELSAAYGDRVTIGYDELFGEFLFRIDVPEPGVLWGALTGDEPGALITTIDGGQGCGE